MSLKAETSISSEAAASHWDLDRIVAELRTSRAGARQTRKGAGGEMPSREALVSILEGLFAALFPTHFGLPDLTDEGIDYFVGNSLDATLRVLVKQVQRELQFNAQQSDGSDASQAREA